MTHSLTQDSYTIPIPISRAFTSPKDNPDLRLNNSNALDKAIYLKKKIIKTLITTNLGSCQYIAKSKRKPSVLLRFEGGLKEYLFGKNGRLINYIPHLRNQLIMKENKQKNKIFNTKIDFGELTYLNYKENDCGLNQRINDVKRSMFQKSHYFNIKKDQLIINNNNTTTTTKLSNNNSKLLIKSNTPSIQNMKLLKLKSQQSTRTRNLAFAPNKKMISYFNKNNNCNTNTEPSSITNKETSTRSKTIGLIDQSNLSLSYYYNHNHTLPIMQSRAINPKAVKDNISPIGCCIQRKLINKKIVKKANIIKQRQIKLEKRLFRIIDKAQIPESKFRRQMDIEAIFETKAKKKKVKGQTKELYLKAIQVKNDYRCMESSKADLLKLSDTINNMPDEIALGLADRLIEEYWKKSVKAKVDLVEVPEIIKRKREKQSRLLRNRISKNTEKMVQMKNELIIEKNQLMNIIEQNFKQKD